MITNCITFALSIVAFISSIVSFVVAVKTLGEISETHVTGLGG